MKKLLLLSILMAFFIAPAAHAVSLTVTSFKCNDMTALSIESGGNINCAVRIQNNDGSNSASVNTIKLMVSGGWAEQSLYTMTISTTIPAGQSIERTFEGIKATTTGSNLKFSAVDIDGTQHAEEVTSVSINSMAIKTVSLLAPSSAGALGEFDASSTVSVGGDFDSMTLELSLSGCSLKSGEVASKSLGSMSNNAAESRSWKVIQGSRSSASSCSLTVTATGSTDTATMAKPKSASVTNPDYVAPSASTTSSGGGGGGGGGGVGSKVSKTWKAIALGASAAMPINSSSVDLTKIEFVASEHLSNVRIIISKLGTRPASVRDAPQGTLYEYISISVENMTEEQVKDAEIEFRVDKSWISENGADSSGIVLNRYSGERWIGLSTSLTFSDTKYAYFRAKTPGFSYFAITYTKKATDSPASTQPPANPQPEEIENTEDKITANAEQESASSGYFGNVAIYLVILAIVAAALYFYYKKRA